MHAYIVYVLYTCVHVFTFMYMLYNKYACIFVSVCVHIYEYIFPCNHNSDQDTEPVYFLEGFPCMSRSAYTPPFRDNTYPNFSLY